MRIFPSQRAVHRRERRFLRGLFLVMGVFAVVFTALLVARVGLG